jgi:hypothetical protein
MYRNLFLIALLVGMLPLSAAGQVGFFEDFDENYFPGPEQRPGFLYWLGGGVGGGIDPFNPTFPTEISTDGLGEFQQAWKITFDTTNTTNWYWFGGSGGVAYGSPEFPIGGVTVGGNDPSNWVFSVDVRGVGMHTDVAMVSSFEFYDPDYEVVFAVDANNDGDMLDGATTWKSGGFQLVDNDGNPDGFTSNSLRLDQGTTPTTDVVGDIPRFGNDGTWVLGFFGGGGEYQFGANSVTVDNIMIEFNAPPAVPGDYNGDGNVNAADYTVWRDTFSSTDDLRADGSGLTAGEPDGVVDLLDYGFWVSQFGNGGGAAITAAGVPEPCSVILTIFACAALAIGRPRRTS